MYDFFLQSNLNKIEINVKGGKLILLLVLNLGKTVDFYLQ